MTFAYVYVVARAIHLGRAIPIQLAVERHPCLDELHESRKIQALIKIGPEKDRNGRYAGNSLDG